MTNALLEIIALHDKDWFNKENPNSGLPDSCEECNRSDQEGLNPTEFPCRTRLIAEAALKK